MSLNTLRISFGRLSFGFGGSAYDDARGYFALLAQSAALTLPLLGLQCVAAMAQLVRDEEKMMRRRKVHERLYWGDKGKYVTGGRVRIAGTAGARLADVRMDGSLYVGLARQNLVNGAPSKRKRECRLATRVSLNERVK